MDPGFLRNHGLVLQDKIGEGSFGQVYKGFYLDQAVAIKVFSNQVLSETNIMENIKHEHVIRFIKYLKFGSFHYLIMELADGGNISRLLNQKLEEDIISSIMANLLRGIQYLHGQCIIHRDIKPDNILLKNADDVTDIRIADFGLSVQYLQENKYPQMSQKCGTVIYMAPEQILNLSYNKSVDLWSCGIVMYMLLSGRHPFYPKLKTTQDFIEAIPSMQADDIDATPLARDLIRRLLCVDKNERYTATQALHHPWITRRLRDPIPMSLLELSKMNTQRDDLILKIKAMMFFHFIISNSHQNQEQELEEDTYSLLVQPIHTIEEEEECSPYLEKVSPRSKIITKLLKKPKQLEPLSNSGRLIQLNQLLNSINASPSPKSYHSQNSPNRKFRPRKIQNCSIEEQQDFQQEEKVSNENYTSTNLSRKPTELSIKSFKNSDLSNISPQKKAGTSSLAVLPVLTEQLAAPSISPQKIRKQIQVPQPIQAKVSVLKKSQSSYFVGNNNIRSLEDPESLQASRKRIDSIDKLQKANTFKLPEPLPGSLSNRRIIMNSTSAKFNPTASTRSSIIGALLEQQKLNIILPTKLQNRHQ